MPSAFESLFAGTAAVSLLDFHGEQITRIPVGSTSAETVFAIVDVTPPEVTKDKGDGRVFKPKVLVADSVTSRIGDKWLIGGMTFFTENIAPLNGDGLRPVELTKTSPNLRTAK
jgi:hypothetical protein